MRIRDRLHKQVKQNSSHFLLRKTQRNKVNNMIKYAREQFCINVNDMLDKNGKSNPKSYWKLVKKMIMFLFDIQCFFQSGSECGP